MAVRVRRMQGGHVEFRKRLSCLWLRDHDFGILVPGVVLGSSMLRFSGFGL